MVPLTRLNGRSIVVNALFIETIEETPDTVITLTTGNKIIVLEKVSDVVSLVQSYMEKIGSTKAVVKMKLTEESDGVSE